MMKENKELMEIDMVHIRQLRHSGKAYEATQLLAAYQQNLKKSWKEGKKRNYNLSIKEIKIKRKHNGLCPRCESIPEENKNYCSSCLQKFRDQSKKYKDYHCQYMKSLILERKKKGLCITCGKSKNSSFIRCDICRLKNNEYQKKYYQKKKKENKQ